MSVSSNEIGELLIDLGLITHSQLSDAVQLQLISGHRLTVVLSEMGLITERQLKDALELQYGVNFVNLCGSPPPDEFVQMVPEEVERQFRFVPVSKQGTQITVAMVNPDDLVATDAIKQHVDTATIKKLVCTADDFEHLMRSVYEKPSAESVLEQTEEEAAIALVEEEEELADNHQESMSPRASQTKLKAHMRNLFESDSDDDLDDMFGQSGDDIPAIPELEAAQDQSAEISENGADEADAEAEVSHGSTKKSFKGLFGDDDDDDFGDDFASSESAPESSDVDAEPEPVAEVAPEEEVPEQEATMPSNQLLEHILQEAGVPASKPKKLKKKSMQSLFDDDDMDFGDDFDKAEAAPEPVAEAQPEPEPEVESEAPSEPEPEVEEQEEETAPEPEEELPSADEEVESESVEKEEIATEIEPPLPQSDSGARPSLGKAFRSLFDDEMDEDDLFNDAEPAAESLTEEKSLTVDDSPEVVADTEETEDSTEAEPVDEDPESAESLMSAIEKPFQSLFDDDDDDDDLFGGATVNEETEVAEDEQPEAQGEETESETEAEAEPEEESELGFGDELSSEEDEVDYSQLEEPVEEEAPAAAAEPAEEPAEEEIIQPAYNASFDDEMDEDSLFASASHPIPEGAPHLRDLLSRFDDSDAAFDALEESLKHQHPEIAESQPEPEKKDAELAVSALLAALDEQHPDEDFQARLPEPTDEESPSEESTEEEPPAEEETVEDTPLAPEPEVVEEEVSSVEAEPEEIPAQPQKTTAQPKARRLRALMSDMNEGDQLSESSLPSIREAPGEPQAFDAPGEPQAFDAPAEPQSFDAPDTTGGAAAEAEESEVEPESEKIDFDEVRILDNEDLMPPSNATTELPPVVVSRVAKTMTHGTSAQDEGVVAPEVDAFDEPEIETIAPEEQVAAAASVEPVIPVAPAPAVAAPAATAPVAAPTPAVPAVPAPAVPAPAAMAPAASVEPAAAPAPQTVQTAPAPSIPVLPPTNEKIVINTTVPLPATAAELPDALDDVLNNVTNEIIDNVELANLSGNRTEISFLEEIVESELGFSDEASALADALSAPDRATPAAPVQPAPQPVTPPSQQAPAQSAPAASAAAQTAPAQAPREVPDNALKPSQAAVDKLNLDPSILNLATQILSQAVNSPCSDVHFEPLADGLALRFMSDGELLDETILPAQIQGMLILCLKSMAGMDPAICDRPQDKKFVTRSFGEPVEMRITSIPGIHGEMVAVSLKT